MHAEMFMSVVLRDGTVFADKSQQIENMHF